MQPRHNSGSIGVIGGGLIGCGWALSFASCGRDVIIYDINPNAPRQFEEFAAKVKYALNKDGSPQSFSMQAKVTITSDLSTLSDVTFVQECLPEQLDLKQSIIQVLEDIISNDVIIATSTSGLSVSDIQAKARRPERILGGHPFNPVYLLPLVEVAGGNLTSRQNIESAAAFYKFLGREVCVLDKEAKGFIANRLSRAVWREALNLYQAGIADFETIDRAMRFGPGLRWSAQGPFEVYHCAGGSGGIEHFFRQFGPGMQAGFDALSESPKMTESLIRKIVDEVTLASGESSVSEREERRDRLISIFLLSEQNGQKDLLSREFSLASILGG